MDYLNEMMIWWITPNLVKRNRETSRREKKDLSPSDCWQREGSEGSPGLEDRETEDTVLRLWTEQNWIMDYAISTERTGQSRENLWRNKGWDSATSWRPEQLNTEVPPTWRSSRVPPGVCIFRWSRFLQGSMTDSPNPANLGSRDTFSRRPVLPTYCKMVWSPALCPTFPFPLSFLFLTTLDTF